MSPAAAAELFREHGAPVRCAAETRVTDNATHDWQHLHVLLQQNLAVVSARSAVHFHPRLDEEQLSADQF